ncbi:MAG: hypothetical protein DMF52_03965 [Acidobacteria bacterium]|nr:MAG: hypothetical protein DMF52_03965 [Acidobacteriota bacterium]
MIPARGRIAARRRLRARVLRVLPAVSGHREESIVNDEVQVMTACPQIKRRGPAARLAGILVPVFLAVAAALQGVPSEALGEDTAKLYVHIETPGRFSYLGDPTQVSILLKNEGAAPWLNPGLDIEGGFQVLDSEGNKLEKAKIPPMLKDGQPKVLEPNAYFGKIVNLNQYFPKIAAIGTYRITWSAAGIPEQSLATRIIKKYDPARDYQAVIDTDFGKIVIEFYKDLAPYHTRNFIDLANLNFYDGLLFHRIVKGEMILGGSPTGDERGSPGYNVPPETNGLKVLPGVVAQVRNSQTGPDESGSIFMIAATAQPDLDARVTVFGRVVEGLDTVKAITNVPTVGSAPRAASRPIKDVTIKKIEIREKKAKT